MLAYFMKIEISRRLHNSFAIAWGILEVTILVLLLNTNYLNIPKELYITTNYKMKCNLSFLKFNFSFTSSIGLMLLSEAEQSLMLVQG